MDGKFGNAGSTDLGLGHVGYSALVYFSDLFRFSLVLHQSQVVEPGVVVVGVCAHLLEQQGALSMSVKIRNCNDTSWPQAGIQRTTEKQCKIDVQYFADPICNIYTSNYPWSVKFLGNKNPFWQTVCHCRFMTRKKAEIKSGQPPVITYIFILELSLVDYNVLDANSTAVLLLIDRVLFVDFFTCFFRQVVEGILVYHTRSLKLK